MGCGCGGSKRAATNRAEGTPAGVTAEGYYWRGPKRELSGPPARTESARAVQKTKQ